MADAGVPVSAVVFDLGRVLIEWDPRHLYRTLLDDDTAVEAFLAEVCTLDWHAQHDAGRPFAETIPEHCARHPEHAALIRAWADRYVEMSPFPVPGMVELVEELHDADVALFGLTNMPAEVWEPLCQRFGFLDRLRDTIVSGHEGMVKPDPRIFALVVARFRLDAPSTVFVDDTAANVEAARTAGLQALRFTGADQLRRDLAELGLKRA